MTPTQTAAERYTRLGWYLVPVPPGTKGPNQPGWNTPANCISTPKDCEFWKKNPDWNMGVLLSESGLAVLDVDHLEHCRLIFDALGLDYDKTLKPAPRIYSRPGRDKAIFKLPPGVTLSRKSLSWPPRPGEKKGVTVLELRAGPVQDVLPPSVHPDTGKPYTWANEPDNIPELPEPILQIWQQWDRFRPQLEDVCPWHVIESRPPSRERQINSAGKSVIDAFNEAHSVEAMLEQYGYRRTRGARYLSPHSTTGLAGVKVWPDENRAYSHHGSEPFDTTHGIDPFFLFAHYDHQGNTQAAIRAAAKLLSLGDPVAVDSESIDHGRRVWQSWQAKRQNPDHDLLSVPGILQDVVDWYNTTAAKPQPQFAVQAALAVGATVMGRRWRTDQQNYSGLYLVCVGKSASGKEHVKTAVEKVLEDAGLEHLIGPSNYTSGSGLLSALLDQPTHISIMDELGRQLETSTAKTNSHKLEAQTMMMEAFGRMAGTLRPAGYSTMSLTKAQKQAVQMERRSVKRPCLSVLAMTTPETLYRTLSSRYVSDGFLGRFLIVESDTGRQTSRMVTMISPSSRALDWCRQAAQATAAQGNLSDQDTADIPPEPVLVPFDQRCRKMLEQYDLELIRRMDDVEADGLEAMFGRTKEIAQRVSLIVAHSMGSPQILPDHLDWAIRYTRKYAEQMVERLSSSLSDSPFEQACKEVAGLIRASGLRGATEYEISRKSREFRGLKPRERAEIMETMKSDYGAELQAQETRGRPRTAWVIT